MEQTTCDARTRDGGECKRRAGWGTDHVGEGRCKQHGGNAGAPTGEANGSFDHGAWSEINDDDVEAIVEVFEDAAERDNLDPVWMRGAGEAFANYRKSGDARHLSECRRWLDKAGGDDETLTLGDIEIAADFTDD